jgi:hypothetical protein
MGNMDEVETLWGSRQPLVEVMSDDLQQLEIWI